MDELSKSIQEPVPWCMLFADDIVLVAETKQSLNERLEEWRVALEDKGLRISRSKTEYLCCDFSGVGDSEDTQITIEDQVVLQITKFKYLGSFVQSNGEIDSDVTHRIQAGWYLAALKICIEEDGKSFEDNFEDGRSLHV
ncbi:uncharacterized protein LOC143597557 [Bidens hawaiensis]|uniref:uncharacterized protein LOC143597557 n=1 Tax=Bidens hawaiensis TaxID=980011 RepID=UPI00404A9C59